MRPCIVTAAYVAGLAMLAPANTQAQSRDAVEAAYSATFDDCLATGDAARGVTGAMVTCILAERRRQDGRLNRAYKGALAGLRADQRATLRQSERTWIAHRDAKCDRAYHQEGGTIDRVLGASCTLRETTARRLWLDRYTP